MIRERGHWTLGRAALAAVCCVALLQILLGLAGLVAAEFGAEWTRPTAVLDWQRAVVILAFGALAAHLLLGARRDPRAEHLGTLLLLIAVFYAHPPIRALANGLPDPWAQLVLAVSAVPIDACTPAVAWLFVRDFPRALEWRRIAMFVRGMIGASALAAAVLIGANIAIYTQGEAGVFASLDRTSTFSRYWSVVFGLLAPMLPFMLWRTRHAPRDERRRVGLFASGLAAAGVLPIAIAVVPPLWEPARTFVHGDWARTFLIPLNLLMILSLAATTTYSVVVNRVLDVRTVLRMAAQYWLATVVAGALAAIPFLVVASTLYGGRREPLSELIQGRRGLLILGLLASGAALLRLRRQVMLGVDRLFFREPYDAERILASLASQTRAAGSTEGLARAVMEQLEGALHPMSIGVLVAARAGEDLLPVASPLRALPRGSALVPRLSIATGPVDVDLTRPGEALLDLPSESRVWLGDAGAALLVPLVGSVGELDGVLALGPKRSELPYSRQDRMLLELVAGATGIGLENRRLKGSDSVRPAVRSDRAASECRACREVLESGVERCPMCGGPVRKAALPVELFGKFRLERWIGAGAMGVVYGALDLALGRRVALKTLPRTNPEEADHLRREARAMAAITHPNLALILGAETWQGTPVLVLEYLAGGTLEARLEVGGLPAAEAFDLSARMARVLERVHKAGLLHRDVKPSNVGFTEHGEPKLLDFGLVQILSDVVPAKPLTFEAPAQEVDFAGTPIYMSPEALDGRRPEPGFDLWSLAVVAFEAVAGRHPFKRESGAATQAAIRRGYCEELSQILPSRIRTAGDSLFHAALSADRGRRPNTAAELAEGFRKVADALS
jgi:hypothetical protein